MALDPTRLALAKQVALGRWGKSFGASIKSKLDEPKEWVDESNHLNNDLMPPLLAAKAPNLQWVFALPIEFANPPASTVGSYALFIYAHLKSTAELQEALQSLCDEHLGDLEDGEGDAGEAVNEYLGMYTWGMKQ